MRSTALLRLAVLLTGGDRHAAEDLLQIALMKAYGAGRASSSTRPTSGR
jgi:DNA-directed RNA polymerase specialized sigma24 family protein